MNGQCGSSRRRRVSRKLKGGMGYGFGGTIGTAGPVWDASWGGEVTKSGTPIYDTADRPPVTGGRRRKSRRGGYEEPPEQPEKETGSEGKGSPANGGRRRKSRKASKKAKKSRRRRTMKGGMSVAHASAGFTGEGARGLAIYKDVGSSQPFSNDVVPLS